ncbi:hypothetical protein IW262DRAFT_1301101 [Armillaria fumosa]|nr:hypothetical protein IW262DRAFT_1301101 [Armillaria fumosa]
MSTPTHPIESQPLGDAPEFPPVKNIDGMEPYDTFFKRIPLDVFHRYRWEDPILVILDDHNMPFISWEMAQIVVSVLHDLPTTLESKGVRNWVVKCFQLCEESTQEDPDHIVLPTNGSVLCYRHEPDAEFLPIRCLDAIGKASYIAHNDADHDYSKKVSTFVIVGSATLQPYPVNFSGYCPTCKKTAKVDYDCRGRSTPKSTATVSAGFSRSEQRRRMLSIGRDEEEDADLYKWNKTIHEEPSKSAVPVSRQSWPDVASETAMPGMGRDQDGYFDMAPPNILDEDDDVPASQAMLEIENSCVYQKVQARTLMSRASDLAHERHLIVKHRLEVMMASSGASKPSRERCLSRKGTRLAPQFGDSKYTVSTLGHMFNLVERSGRPVNIGQSKSEICTGTASQLVLGW